MFIATLKFSGNKDQMSQFLGAHKKWIKQGFDDGIFLLAGSLQPGLGGGILAHNITRADLEARLNEDPFVQQKIVTADVLEIDPSMTDERLAFLRE